MLGVHGVGRDRADYYLADLAHELPVSSPGRWAGAAAAGLGLAGPLQPGGVPPPARGPPSPDRAADGSGRVAVAAFDLTFSAPKSASVLFALGGRGGRPRRSSAPTPRRWPGALAYLERHGIAARSALGSRADRGRDHRDDRRALHPRASTATATRTCTATSSWRTSSTAWTGGGARATDAGLAAHRHAAAAVYEAHLRAGLSVGRSACAGREGPDGRPRSPASVPRCSASSPRGPPTSAAACTRSGRTLAPGATGSPGRPPARPRSPGLLSASSPRSGPGGRVPSEAGRRWGSDRPRRAAPRAARCSTSTASPARSR